MLMHSHHTIGQHGGMCWEGGAFCLFHVKECFVDLLWFWFPRRLRCHICERTVNVAYLQRTVVNRLCKEQQRDEKKANVRHKYSTVIPDVGVGSEGNADTDSQKYNSTKEV